MAKAEEKDLPPGAAHTSSTRSPGRTPAARDTSRAAGSWTRNFPAWKAGSAVRSPVWESSRQPGTQGWVRTVTPDSASSAVRRSASVRRGFTWIVRGAGALFAARNASVSGPRTDRSRFTSHLG